MSQSSSEIKIRQLLYYKTPPQTTIPSQRSAFKLQTLEHKLGRTKYTTQTMTETRPFFENFMGKPEMQQTFGFKLPFIVEEHENQRVQIHFLEVFTHSQVLVESYIAECKKTLAQLKDESAAIKNQMMHMKEQHELGMEAIEYEFHEACQKKWRQLKEDYVQYSTESFRLNKEISKLLKEKLQLEGDTMAAMNRVVRLEKQLQGVEMDLECENEEALQTQLKGTFTKTKRITH